MSRDTREKSTTLFAMPQGTDVICRSRVARLLPAMTQAAVLQRLGNVWEHHRSISFLDGLWNCIFLKLFV